VFPNVTTPGHTRLRLPRACKNIPDPFPGSTSYKSAKPGFSFLMFINYVMIPFGFLSHVMMSAFQSINQSIMIFSVAQIVNYY